MACVREVFIRPRLSTLPLSPSRLAGLVRFRGDVIPVIHLDQCLDAEMESGEGTRNRVVILQTARGLLGLLVDQVGQMEGDPPLPSEPDGVTGTIEVASRAVSFIHLDALVDNLKETLLPRLTSTGALP